MDFRRGRITIWPQSWPGVIFAGFSWRPPCLDRLIRRTASASMLGILCYVRNYWGSGTNAGQSAAVMTACKCCSIAARTPPALSLPTATAFTCTRAAAWCATCSAPATCARCWARPAFGMCATDGWFGLQAGRGAAVLCQFAVWHRAGAQRQSDQHRGAQAPGVRKKTCATSTPSPIRKAVECVCPRAGTLASKAPSCRSRRFSRAWPACIAAPRALTPWWR